MKAELAKATCPSKGGGEGAAHSLAMTWGCSAGDAAGSHPLCSHPSSSVLSGLSDPREISKRPHSRMLGP